MEKWLDLDMFPVKVQVPMMMTVYALLTFKKFELTDPTNSKEDSWFDVPADYEVCTRIRD